jgi:transposase
VVARRKEFEAWIKTTDFSKLVFIDETGCNIQLVREYAWGHRSERVVDRRPTCRRENVTIVGAIALDGVRCHEKFTGALDTQRWIAFVERRLVPTLREGDVVVMDNLAIHKNQVAKEAIERAGATVAFLPPYSPEFNPIELCWSLLKNVLRSIRATTTQELIRSVWRAFRRVTSRHLNGWFRECGYAIN